MSGGIFGVVRPYDDWMRERVFKFLASMGYVTDETLVVSPGESDTVGAEWVERAALDLLLLPYHKHRSTEGPFVDGVGVALCLSELWVSRTPDVPILMPVTDFSLGVSFDRRFELLVEKQPILAERVVVMPESQLGSKEIAARIREIASA